MVLEELKEFLDKELNKFIQKSSTSASDQEWLCKTLCNYEQVIKLWWMDKECRSEKMSHGYKSNHSMRDKEIAALEDKINEASSDYEREFYRKLIRAAQEIKE